MFLWQDRDHEYTNPVLHILLPGYTLLLLYFLLKGDVRQYLQEALRSCADNSVLHTIQLMRVFYYIALLYLALLRYPPSIVLLVLEASYGLVCHQLRFHALLQHLQSRWQEQTESSPSPNQSRQP